MPFIATKKYCTYKNDRKPIRWSIVDYRNNLQLVGNTILEKEQRLAHFDDVFDVGFRFGAYSEMLFTTSQPVDFVFLSCVTNL